MFKEAIFEGARGAVRARGAAALLVGRRRGRRRSPKAAFQSSGGAMPRRLQGYWRPHAPRSVKRPSSRSWPRRNVWRPAAGSRRHKGERPPRAARQKRTRKAHPLKRKMATRRTERRCGGGARAPARRRSGPSQAAAAAPPPRPARLPRPRGRRPRDQKDAAGWPKTVGSNPHAILSRRPSTASSTSPPAPLRGCRRLSAPTASPRALNTSSSVQSSSKNPRLSAMRWSFPQPGQRTTATPCR